MKSITFMAVLGWLTCLIACKHTDKTNVMEKKATQNERPSAAAIDTTALLQKLKEGADLSTLFNDNWEFIYHEDNRCDGSTDGQIDSLSKTAIAKAITLSVKNDGEGWACDKKEPRTYELAFHLKEKLANWDRFEIQNDEELPENIFRIEGAGASDFITLHYNKDNLIIRLEYRSEDPG